jgi:hypothetical protein
VTPIRPGRPEAAAVVWEWNRPRAAAQAVSAGRERLLGTLQGAVVAAVGFLLFRHWSRAGGLVALVVSGVILVSALASPTGLYAGVKRAFLALGHLTGRALAWLLMPLVFYGFFLPFGRLMRRGRRDRLKRFYEPGAESYWEPHSGPTAASGSPDRQY